MTPDDTPEVAVDVVGPGDPDVQDFFIQPAIHVVDVVTVRSPEIIASKTLVTSKFKPYISPKDS